ncbi:hypothetical protein [Lentibacillus sediminis]|uniref:hypothetical protein n=1 Tax=Lentibacillus sediminis TaxID=1940529 RepID=UPI000C1C02F7|nr:hypothetical protein [Lentibacillus sediminis]
MKKEKVIYRFHRYEGKVLYAKKEISFELKLAARLLMDEICFSYNKEQLNQAIDQSLKTSRQHDFLQLSEAYRQYVWE